MKKIVRIAVRIKGTDKIFAEGFGPGEISEQILEYDEDPKTYDRPTFIASLNQQTKRTA